MYSGGGDDYSGSMASTLFGLGFTFFLFMTTNIYIAQLAAALTAPTVAHAE